MVGIPVTRYDEGVTGFSSTFIFRKVILSPWSAAISLRIGSTWRQGPHHSAQKSTKTGLSDLRTWVSKSESVTAEMSATDLPFVGVWSSQQQRGDSCSAPVEQLT